MWFQDKLAGCTTYLRFPSSLSVYHGVWMAGCVGRRDRRVNWKPQNAEHRHQPPFFGVWFTVACDWPFFSVLPVLFARSVKPGLAHPDPSPLWVCFRDFLIGLEDPLEPRFPLFWRVMSLLSPIQAGLASLSAVFVHVRACQPPLGFCCSWNFSGRASR